ncbi:MAG TPA: alpha/beta hydrolase [Acidimicrobiales bacterium]
MHDVVLVHGAWHGAWAFDEVLPALEQRGLSAHAVELPLQGFPGDAAAARAAIEAAGPGAVVVGHSYGGFVISAAARDLHVGHLVYMTAFMVDEGEDPWAPWFARPVLLHDAIAQGTDGRLSTDLVHEALYADSDRATTGRLIDKLRPMPQKGPPIDFSDPAWRHIPSTYVVCSRDQAIHPEVQRHMSRHAGTVIEWDCDHSPFMTRPAEIAALIASLVSTETDPEERQ